MELEFIDNTLVAKIKGDMDHFNVSNMRTELDKKINEHPVKNLIFDLSELDFMDSSGIGLLLGRYKMIKAFGGNVLISGAKSAVEKVILISGLNKIIPMCKALDDAIETVCGVMK